MKSVNSKAIQRNNFVHAFPMKTALCAKLSFNIYTVDPFIKFLVLRYIKLPCK